MLIEIEKSSGCCFGVDNAIKIAENELYNNNHLYCLGEIVHNAEEITRLEKIGLKTINKDSFLNLKNTTVLLRAHGEPLETYNIAKKNNIKLIDATCPIVLKLQQRIAKKWIDLKDNNGQLIIFGKKDHPEVIGLNSKTNNNAIIISKPDDIYNIDFKRDISLFSQTTMNVSDLYVLFDNLKTKLKESGYNSKIELNDTICRKVANRENKLSEFAKNNDILLFISGKNSSNGAYLHQVCKNANPRSYKISGIKEINTRWFKNVYKIGICGATSSPMWQLEKVKTYLENLMR